MENVSKALEDVIQVILDSPDYQTCISLKKQMSENKEITELIEKIKILQKKYIRSEYDSSVKKELDSYQKQLDDIPIYHIYSESLERVNWMIDTVKESMNDYFSSLLEL
ncbi:MAG: YlbF family regulator [Bacilli bacterium]|nr:YlbF family regulator [Bacilli bacterium]